MKSYQVFVITLAILLIAHNPTITKFEPVSQSALIERVNEPPISPTQSLSSFSTPKASPTIQPIGTDVPVSSSTIVTNGTPTVLSLSDLSITAPPNLPSEFGTGFTRTLTTYVINMGDTPSQPTTVEFWKREIKEEGIHIGTVTTPILEAGHGSLITMTWNIQQHGGGYYFYAIVDPENVVTESDESNNISWAWLLVPSVIIKANTSISEYDYGATVPITITAINNTPSLNDLNLTIQWWITDEGNRDVEAQVQTLQIPSESSEGSITTTWRAGDSDPGIYGIGVRSFGPDQIMPAVPEVWGTYTEFRILEDPTVDNTDRRVVKEIFGPVVSTRYEQHKVKAISCTGMPEDHCIVKVEVFSKIGQLTELEELKLSGIYNLTTLPPEIGRLSKLKILLIAAPELTNLPPEIGKLTNLTELIVSYNLSELPPEIGKLTNLTLLDLSKNQLTTLPPEIKNLTKLTRLNLSRNRLSTLPSGISNLSSLKLLGLVENEFVIFPEEIEHLTNLEYLSLSKNHLTTLPPEIGTLANLKKLDIEDNQITALPPEIGKLTKLESLDLRGNQLTALPPEIIQLKSLKFLDLSDNNFPVRPPEIDQMSNLGTVELEGNPFYEKRN